MTTSTDRAALEAAGDLPAVVVAGLLVLSAAIGVAVAVPVVGAGIRLYERLAGPLDPVAAFAPPRATEATPVPHSRPSVPARA